MANSRSARKRIRADLRKRAHNKNVRSAVRTRVATARKALLAGETVNVEETLRLAVRELDRAGEKGILHRNNVRRRKSRLQSMASRILSLSATDETAAAAARAAAAGGEKGRSAKGGAKSAKATKPAAKKAAKSK